MFGVPTLVGLFSTFKRLKAELQTLESIYQLSFGIYGLALGSVPDGLESEPDGLVLFVPAGALIKTAIKMLAITIKMTVAASIKNVDLEIGPGVELKDFSLAPAVSPRLMVLSAMMIFLLLSGKISASDVPEQFRADFLH
jgi:hypothetical protein